VADNISDVVLPAADGSRKYTQIEGEGKLSVLLTFVTCLY
jgi:hypothetical protein